MLGLGLPKIWDTCVGIPRNKAVRISEKGTGFILGPPI